MGNYGAYFLSLFSSCVDLSSAACCPVIKSFVSYVLYNFLKVHIKRANLVLVIPSWLEVEFSTVFLRSNHIVMVYSRDAITKTIM